MIRYLSDEREAPRGRAGVVSVMAGEGWPSGAALADHPSESVATSGTFKGIVRANALHDLPTYLIV